MRFQKALDLGLGAFFFNKTWQPRIKITTEWTLDGVNCLFINGLFVIIMIAFILIQLELRSMFIIVM
ncbi:hypothetical protein BG31_22120 [Bacillus subtilis subsp. subtilis]|nr:hypothetical protein BSR08_19330 [Bacillus subtilis]AYK59386.1 hypothetical protein D9C10_20905 [Bacillus subtilis subsp. subtilis]API96417.1 hypothetical protein BKP58_11425 [Bacillus subtilis]ARI86879.1 hypothetical protein B7470_12530 [Bacillus subtilis]ASZ59886.1 hypothetical protein CLD04_00915 [Bacillus subtilis]